MWWWSAPGTLDARLSGFAGVSETVVEREPAREILSGSEGPAEQSSDG